VEFKGLEARGNGPVRVDEVGLRTLYLRLLAEGSWVQLLLSEDRPGGCR